MLLLAKTSDRRTGRWWKTRVEGRGDSVREALMEGSQNLPSAKHQWVG